MNSGDHGVSRHDQAVYDGDLDTKKVVLAVNALKCLISFCDGVLILTPEFNHGVSGVLKSTLDWRSRPVFESCCQRQTDLHHQFLEGIHRKRARAVSA